MPPKKGSGTKPAEDRTPSLSDGLPKDQLTEEQMREHIVRIREDLDREREERNYFQMERDKIHTFWQTTERHEEMVNAELKNLDKDIEEDERRRQVEIKVYKQEMKRLLCEHQNTTPELEADSAVSTPQKEQEQLESQLINDIKATEISSKEVNFEEEINEFELKLDEVMTEKKNSLGQQFAEGKAEEEENTELLSQKVENIGKFLISEQGHNRSSHINAFKEDNNKILTEAQAICDDIERSKEDIKDKIKLEMFEISFKLRMTKEEHARVLRENKPLAVLVKKSEEVAKAVRRMKFATSTKGVTVKGRQKMLDTLKQDHETLTQKSSKLQTERDELYRSVHESIQMLQQEGDLKNALLEEKVQEMKDRLENAQAQLSSLLRAPDVDQTALSEISKKAEENLDSLNNTIINLQYKKAHISQACKDLLVTNERACGVTVEEPSGKPCAISVAGKKDFRMVPK